MKLLHWRSIPFLLFLLLLAFFLRGLSLDPQHLPSAKLNKPLPIFHVPSLVNPKEDFSPKDLQGQIALLNIWASWCEACTEEQLFLSQLARSGVDIYGLNYKDDPKAAKQWLAEWGNPYRMVGMDQKGKVGIDLGVYGTPETFLIDKAGIIRYRHVGILTAKVWNDEFLPRIKSLV